MNTQTTYLASKPHYEILDGLRGVAAIMVIIFHLFETHSLGNHLIQIINHGYLAVDFFFMLSGFVIGYAYDDRWDKMTLGTFFKRRIIRLHPMVIMGSIVWSCTFLFPAIILLSTNRTYTSRGIIVNYATGMYITSTSFEMGCTRMDRNASIEWPSMVVVL